MNIFIHYLDKELLDTYQPKLKYSEDIVNKVRLSIKIAILLLERNDHVFVPVSNYFESELPKIVLDYFRNIIDLDCIKLVSSSKSLQSFIKKKRLVYPSIYSKNQILEENEKILEHGVPGIWTPRSNSATLDITTSWIENVDSSFWSKLYNYSNYNNPSAFEKAIASVPQKLNNKAFIANHVLSKLDLKSEYQIESKETLNSFISKFYIKSFLEEYNAVCFRNFFLLSQADEILPDGYKHIDYGNLCRILSGIEYEKQSLYEYIYGCNKY